METWGAHLYGNPCRDCGYDWSVTPPTAIRQVAALPDAYNGLLTGRTGRERHPGLGWTAAGYVSHVTDNLRIWAERLSGARLAGDVRVPGYDPDLLARARRYDEIGAAAALWSLRGAVDGWVESVSAALADGVVLEHAGRGAQRAEDVARNNAHDATHHLWDIRRILAAADAVPDHTEERH
ncbi:DinB family protein [Streptomyces sp. CAU 1734]|uniref:DinB family protein n=1 Tax=Streptomyces sp. CAU 1734 TaxID=3140360 RepID=UPI00326161C2